MALEKGVPFVVTGSDAHAPDCIALDYEKFLYSDRYNKNIKLIIGKGAGGSE
jgi:translation initiation factor IF-3